MTDPDEAARRVSYGELHDFSARLDIRHADVMAAIKEARIEARESHQRMRQDWTDLFQRSIEYGGRLDRVESDLRDIVTELREAARAVIDARRYLWAQVIAVAAIAAGVFMWIVSLLKGARP